MIDCFNQSFLFLKHVGLVYKQLTRDIYLWDYSKGKTGCDLTIYLNAIKSSLYAAEPSNCLEFGKIRTIFKFEWNVSHSKMQWLLFTFLVQYSFFSLAPPTSSTSWNCQSHTLGSFSIGMNRKPKLGQSASSRNKKKQKSHSLLSLFRMIDTMKDNMFSHSHRENVLKKKGKREYSEPKKEKDNFLNWRVRRHAWGLGLFNYVSQWISYSSQGQFFFSCCLQPMHLNIVDSKSMILWS